MRPSNYREHLAGLLRSTPDVQRVEILESGPYPYALAVTVAGGEHRWQITGQLADGAKHSTPSPAVEGQPLSWRPVKASGAPDVWLAGVIGRSQPLDVERLSVWSAREGSGSTGVTVFFRNKERAFVRLI